jgi:uncharacterized iron-regulated membrane protein
MTKPQSQRFWVALHRYAGLAILLFLSVAAITGCLLSFERPLDRLLNPDLFRPRHEGLVDPIAAVTALERRRPDLAATAFPLQVPDDRNILVAVQARPGLPPLAFDQVFLDRGDGAVVGVRRDSPGWGRAHLVRDLYAVHTTLLVGAPGRVLLGLVALVWLIGNLVGAYLVFPGWVRSWKAWTRPFEVKWSAATPRMMLDLHRAAGLWLLAPLTVLAFTSVSMNFFEEAVAPMVKAFSPPRASPFDQPPPAATPGAARIGLDQALLAAKHQAEVQRPGWRPAVLQVEPDRNLVGVRFTRSGRETYHGLGPVTYWFDGGTGRFRYADDPYRDSAGQKFIRSLYPLHSGEAAAAPGVALDVLLGLAVLGFGVTGVYLWLKRRPGRVAARKARRASRRAAPVAR